MTRKEWKEMLPIITAFANGERVQRVTVAGNWMTYESYEFSDHIDNYRIAPKSEDAEWLRNEANRYHYAGVNGEDRLRAIADKLERLEGGAE